MFDNSQIDPTNHDAALSALDVPPGTEVGLVVRVGAIGEAQGDPELGTSTVRVRLLPQGGGQQVESTDISTVGNPLIKELRDMAAAGVRVIARGRFLAARRKRGGAAPLRFQIERLLPVVNNLTLVGATPAEVEEAAATLKDAQDAQARGEHDALARYIIKQLHWNIGVMGNHLPTRFRKVQRLTLLQALSGGDIGHGAHNMRLSSYFFSSPGRGKRLLSQFAEVLAPVAELVQPGMITEAGLCACVVMKKGGAVLVPGALPRANKGTCIIEDVGRVNRAHRHGITTALVAVAEDGRLRPLKSVETLYETQTALHLNGNPQSKITTRRASQKDLDVVTQRKNDLGIPLDLFSRLHVVANLDTDEPLTPVAQDMAAGRFSEGRPPDVLTIKHNKRKLRVLVAYLLDRFEAVDLGPVSDRMERVMDQVSAVVREATARLPPGLAMEEALDEESICLRMANALRVVVAAEARLQGRAVAEPQDVELGASMISMKLEVLRWLAGDTREVRPLMPLPYMAERAETLRALRWDDILERFGGQEVRAEQVADALGFTDRLVRLEMEAHGVPMRQGSYVVPTLHGFVEGANLAAAFTDRAQEQLMLLPHEEKQRIARAALERICAAQGERQPEPSYELPDPTQLADEPEDRLDPEEPRCEALPEGVVEKGAYERPLPLPKSRRKRYSDGIPPLPYCLMAFARCLVLPVQDVLKGVFIDGTKVAEMLCEVALQEHSRGALILLAGAHRHVVEGLRSVVDPLQPEVTLRLCREDWVERGLFALSLYLASSLPSVREHLELELMMGRGKKMPPPLRRAVKATIRRLKDREASAAAKAA